MYLGTLAGHHERNEWAGRLAETVPYYLPLGVAGSVFRDEFDLAILQLQENNRLEILKRKWWEGGKCPKEEDHRAKGKPHACWKDEAVEASLPATQGLVSICT